MSGCGRFWRCPCPWCQPRTPMCSCPCSPPGRYALAGAAFAGENHREPPTLSATTTARFQPLYSAEQRRRLASSSSAPFHRFLRGAQRVGVRRLNPPVRECSSKPLESLLLERGDAEVVQYADVPRSSSKALRKFSRRLRFIIQISACTSPSLVSIGKKHDGPAPNSGPVWY